MTDNLNPAMLKIYNILHNKTDMTDKEIAKLITSLLMEESFEFVDRYSEFKKSKYS